MQLGLRNLQATALMRDYRAQDMAFEIVDISLEERTKFRKLLSENMLTGSRGGEDAFVSPAPAKAGKSRV